LSGDKSHVISELRIRIEQALKGNSGFSLTPGQLATILLGGRRLVLPDGRVVGQSISQESSKLDVGNRYMFFLYANLKTAGFTLIKAWGLTPAGVVYPCSVSDRHEVSDGQLLPPPNES
jgi:hypothetical protein